METTIIEEKSSARVWSLGQISLASLIGGPIAGTFLMSRNAKTFGQPRHANQLIFYGFIFSTLIFALLFCLPEAWVERIPHIILPIAYTAVIQEYARHTQKPTIDTHLESGSKRHSYWKVIPYIIILALVTFAWGFVVGFVGELSLVYFAP